MPYSKYLILLTFSGFLLFNLGCQKKNELILGTTNVEELHSQEGSPIFQSKNHHYYGNNTSYQTSNGIVIGHYRPPKVKEKSLNYWQIKWSGKNKTYQVHKEKHRNLLEISLQESGESIFFDENYNAVVRVMEFKRD